MTSEVDPPRLKDGPLGQVVASAAEDAPTAAELNAMAVGLPLSPAVVSGAAAKAAAAKALTVKVLAGLVTMGAVGLVVATAVHPGRWTRAQGGAPVVAAAAAPDKGAADEEVAVDPNAAEAAQDWAVPPGAVASAQVEARPARRVPLVAAFDAGTEEPHHTTGPADAGLSELALLDEAYRALRRGDAEAALAGAARHRAAFPSGSFAQERELIFIEALLALGRSDEARQRGADFVSTFPSSSHRPRVEGLLRQSDAGR